jgi:hypothetical protein
MWRTPANVDRCISNATDITIKEFIDSLDVLMIITLRALNQLIELVIKRAAQQ